MSPEARSSRGDERRLSLRTLVIASIASATAAIVTSLFWRRGTPIAAALTPVIVSLVSELLHRPTAVIADKLTTERDALPERLGRGLRSGTPQREPTAVRTPHDPDAERDLEAIRALRREAPTARGGGSGPRHPDPPANGVSDVSVYRPPAPRRRLPVKLIVATAALAFVIGTALITVPELLAGRSIGHGDRQFSVLGGERKAKKATPDRDRDATQTTETQPSEQEPDRQQTTPQDPADEQQTPEQAEPQQPQSQPEDQQTTPQTTTRSVPPTTSTPTRP